MLPYVCEPLWPPAMPEDPAAAAETSRAMESLYALSDAYSAAEEQGDEMTMAMLRAQVAADQLPAARAALVNQDARIAAATDPEDVYWLTLRRGGLQRHLSSLLAAVGATGRHGRPGC